MQARALSWPDFYATAQRFRFLYPQVIKAQVDQLLASCRSPSVRQTITPILISVGPPQPRNVLAVKCVIHYEPTAGNAPVELFITFNEVFPNAYPVFSIEQPKPPFKIASHPNVDERGIVYLPAVSSWNPRTSTLLQCVDELFAAVQSKPVFAAPQGAVAVGGGRGGVAGPAGAAAAGATDASITPTSWEGAIQEATRADPVRSHRVIKQIQEVQRGCQDATPMIAVVQGMKFIVIKVVIKIPNACAPLSVIITLPQGFPDAFPKFSLEPPPPPFKLTNTPHVDDKGTCYLSSLSRWHAFQSTLVQCLYELKEACADHFPIISTSIPISGARPVAGGPSQPQPQQPQPQQSAAPMPFLPAAISRGALFGGTVLAAARPQQQQQQQAPAPAPAPVTSSPPPASRSGDKMSEAELAECNRMIAEAQSRGHLPPGGASSTSSASAARPQQQQQWDSAPTTPQTQPQYQQASSQPYFTQPQAAARPQPQQQPLPPVPVPVAQQSRVVAAPVSGAPPLPDASFFVVLAGGAAAGFNRVTGAEFVPPVGFGIKGLRLTTRTGALLLNSAAPYPLAPVTEPTPDESHENAKKATEEEAKGSWVGWAAAGLKRGVTAVEDKARSNVKSKDQERFERLWPDLAANYTVVADYKCRGVVGDCSSHEGHITILRVTTSTCIYAVAFSTSDRSVQFHFALCNVVTIVKGVLSGSEWMTFVTVDGEVRPFYDFKTNALASIGTMVGGSTLTGTPFSRCYNWADHCWRASCSVLPHPRFPNYDQASVQAVSNSSMSGFPTDSAAAAPASGASRAAPTTESDQCVVCMDRPKGAFFQPCGHVCVCMPCSEATRTCPICRAQVMQVFQAFVA